MSLLNPTATAVLRAAARPAATPALCKLHLASRPLSTFRPLTPSAALLAKPTPARSPAALQIRPASTTSAAAEQPTVLDWNTFFQMRKTRRRIQVLCSLMGAAACGTGGSAALASGAAESLVSLVPLDPFITMGLMAFASAGLGWLMGPTVGAGLYNMWHHKARPNMDAKEKEFFARIKKHRVDPSTSSVGNPVPDFYGEKISSVQGYRQWLKDQRAYNKKRSSGFV